MALDTHERRTGRRYPDAEPQGGGDDSDGRGISRRAVLGGALGLTAAGVLTALGLKLKNEGPSVQPPTNPGGNKNPGNQDPGNQVGEFDLSVIGDSIEKSAESKQALAGLLGVSASSLKIEVPPQEAWQPGVPEATFAQITSPDVSGGFIKITLPQPGTLTLGEMEGVIKNGANTGATTRWFGWDEGQTIGEVTIPQAGTPGFLGWKNPGTPREYTFGMDASSPALSAMHPEDQINQIWGAVQVLYSAGVFNRP